MGVFQDTREETERKVIVHLLSVIEHNPYTAQRDLANLVIFARTAVAIVK